MGYAIRNDGRGWRAVATADDCMAEETYSDVQPAPVMADAAALARAKRDGLLTACDWTQLADAPLSSEAKAAWAAYRQQLRDVPGQAGFPLAVEWPVGPGA